MSKKKKPIVVYNGNPYTITGEPYTLNGIEGLSLMNEAGDIAFAPADSVFSVEAYFLKRTIDLIDMYEKWEVSTLSEESGLLDAMSPESFDTLLELKGLRQQLSLDMQRISQK